MSSAPITRPSLLLRLRDVEDAEAWREFVEVYTPLAYAYSRHRGLQDADAADVAQEVMQTVARSISSFAYRPEKGSFRSWLYTLTRSRFNNFLARRKRQLSCGSGDSAVRELIEAQPCPETDESWDREYHQRLLEWACAQVGSEFQETTWRAFRLAAVEGKSPSEVAAALGLTIGAVYIARSRITARIRAKVREVTDESVFFSDKRCSAGRV